MLPSAAALFGRLPRMMRRHKLMNAWMRLTGEDPLQLVRIRDTAYGYADMRNGLLRLIVIENEFEADFFRIADAMLADGGVFIDVGANHGLFSFGLAERSGSHVEFHLFEPNPDLIHSIARSKALYAGLSMHVNHTAVSDHDGHVQIEFVKEHSGASHVVSSGGSTTSSVTLDSYLADRNVEHVRLMKIDIEGHELSALRGARQSLENGRFDAIYFEYCEEFLKKNHAPGEIIEYLESMGFAVCYCTTADLRVQPGATLGIPANSKGEVIPLKRVRGTSLPGMTDLLAVPESFLISPAQSEARLPV
jgi:FkbM family methyltransferase